MRRMLLASVLLPLPAMAETVICRADLTCNTLDMACYKPRPGEAEIRVILEPDGKTALLFVETVLPVAMTRIPGAAAHSTYLGDAGSDVTVVLSLDGRGTMALATFKRGRVALQAMTTTARCKAVSD